MKLTLKRSIHMWYTDNRTINIEIPDVTEDIESFVKNYIEENEDEIVDEFGNVDPQEHYGDPDSVWYDVEDENGTIIQWQDY